MVDFRDEGADYLATVGHERRRKEAERRENRPDLAEMFRNGAEDGKAPANFRIFCAVMAERFGVKVNWTDLGKQLGRKGTDQAVFNWTVRQRKEVMDTLGLTAFTMAKKQADEFLRSQTADVLISSIDQLTEKDFRRLCEAVDRRKQRENPA